MANDIDGMKEDYLRHTRELLRQMEGDNLDEAEKVLDEITKLREKNLFQELGKLTREFHEALNSFRLDARIATLAETDIPDARERLNYVIAMTEQAADRTMTAVEDSIPLCQSLEQQADDLKEDWGRFVARELDAKEFRQLSKRLNAFLGGVPTDSAKIRTNLNDVLLAQDFQDLTGQIIRRVITLVEDLEKSLVDLIRLSGQNMLAQGQKEAEEEDDPLAGSGPPVPGVDKGDTVSGQDEVDDLLSSLGF